MKTIEELLGIAEKELKDTKEKWYASNRLISSLEIKLHLAKDGLREISRGEAQFDNVDHMYTARETLKKLES